MAFDWLAGLMRQKDVGGLLGVNSSVEHTCTAIILTGLSEFYKI